MPKAMGTMSRGSNFLPMPRYSSPQAMAIIIRLPRPLPPRVSMLSSPNRAKPSKI